MMKKIWIVAPFFLGLSVTALTETYLDKHLEADNEKAKSELLDYGTMLLAGDVDAITDTAINAAVDEGVGISKSFLERYFPTVEIGAMSVGGEKPQWNFLVVAPLSDENDIFNTVFTQVSANYQDNRTTLNLGLGYRSLSQNKKTLLGINAFYDHELRYDHGRASVGIEALSTMWEMRANKYYALTDAKTGRYDNTERALHGFDVEAGIPVPYMNWATVFVKHFEWQAYGGTDDKEGQNVSLRARFPGFLTGLELEAGRSFYSGSTYSDENFITASYNLTELFKDKPSAQVPWVSSQAFKLESMEDQRFQKVRRSNVIVKQITSAFAAKVSGI